MADALPEAAPSQNHQTFKLVDARTGTEGVKSEGGCGCGGHGNGGGCGGKGRGHEAPLKKPRPVVAAVDTLIRLKRQSRKAVVAAVVRDMAAEVMDTAITVTDTATMVRALKNSFFTRSRRSFVVQPCSRQWILCR